MFVETWLGETRVKNVEILDNLISDYGRVTIKHGGISTLARTDLTLENMNLDLTEFCTE